jgi:hypothetical protein
MRILLLGLGLCACLQAEQRDERLWKASLVSLGVAHAVDSHSSWGKCESNSFVAGAGGRFDVSSLAIKSGVFAGLALFEWTSGRRHPKLYRIFSAANFGVSVGVGAMAARNYSVRVPTAGYVCR